MGDRDFSCVGVVGLGTMGAGIAEVFARQGHRVVGLEVDAAASQRGRARLEASLARAVRRGRLAEEESVRVLAAVTFTTTLDDVAPCGLVVEAAVERLETKKDLLARLDATVGAEAVLATNTSSLPVTELAAATGHPERVVGVHFFNPATVQPLVEVVRTVVSDPGVVQDAAELVRALGKTPVLCGDRAGFIANALLFGYLNQAVTAYDRGQVGREDLDAVMREGWGYPMGPLGLLDLIGLDTAVEVLRTMHAQSGRARHVPAPLLVQLTTAGLLGRKSGRGFYSYEAPGSGRVVADALTSRRDVTPRQEPAAGSVGVLVSDDSRRGPLVQAFYYAGGRLVVSTDAAQLVGTDLVVEATDGDLATRAAALRELDRLAATGTILATTATGTSVGALAAGCARPERVVGLRPLVREGSVRLLEVAGSLRTSAQALEAVLARVERTAPTVLARGDRVGSVADTLVCCYLNDAAAMLEAGYASAEDIDAAMTLGCALPAGPFRMLEEVGPATVTELLRSLHEETGDPDLAPTPLLDQLVAAGGLAVLSD